MMIVRSQ